jgi:HEAT repeat protein
MTTTEADSLFEQTLVGGYDSEQAWAAVHTLRRHGSRDIFERAAAWCRSEDPLRRARAVDVLSQLRRAPGANASAEKPEWMFRDESFVLITRILENEHNPTVLSSAIHALGHLDNERAVPLILSYHAHPDENVRFAVAFALGCFPNHPESVSGLLKLLSDSDSAVRDWAVFGLAVQGDVDSIEIREALIRCLDDVNEDVREEAAVGLGRRQDERLLPKLQMILDEPELKARVAEAAAALLGLDRKPPDWQASDYKAALIRKVQLRDWGT